MLHRLPELDRPTGSIVDIVFERAVAQGDDLALTHLVDGEDEVRTWTYRQLWEAASRVAAFLQSSNAKGERVVLLYDVGLEYIAAFFGIMAAGAIAVPAYPPVRSKMIERLDGSIRDCAPQFVLTTSPFLSMFQSQVKEASSVQWVATDTLPEATYTPLPLKPDGVTMLQYTSGSTGMPKGVMLSPGNIMANCRAGHELLGPAPNRRGFSWLPPFHDLGLIGAILQPLYSGFPLVFMSPLYFIQRPARWLRGISKHRATLSGGPNFSYQLCAQLSDGELEGLDLSCWTEAICGAEPIRPDTLSSFCERLAPHGFSAEAIIPCYGLAESTLLVTAKPAHEAPLSRPFDRARLKDGEASAVAEPGKGVALASSGRVVEGYDFRIVDPVAGLEQPSDRVGEIWIAGPSVALGYWGRREETESTFHCTLPGSPRQYLNTGDLGFLSGGELFVTGRSKDLVIVAGTNHHPEDIEFTVEAAHAALRRGGSVAFGVDSGVEEAFVVIAELEGTAGQEDRKTIASSIRERVTAVHGIAPADVVLCKRGTIERTTSGKVRRAASRERYLAGQLTNGTQVA